jgi:hypothetical protein
MIEATVERIVTGCFEQCDFIRTVTFESGSHLMLIGRDAFHECNSFESVHFGRGLPILGRGAFGDCQLLRDVSFEEASERLPMIHEAFGGKSVVDIREIAGRLRTKL